MCAHTHLFRTYVQATCTRHVHGPHHGTLPFAIHAQRHSLLKQTRQIRNIIAYTEHMISFPNFNEGKGTYTVCRHTHTHARTHRHTHTHTHARTHTHTHARTHAHTHAHTHPPSHPPTHTHTRASPPPPIPPDKHTHDRRRYHHTQLTSLASH